MADFLIALAVLIAIAGGALLLGLHSGARFAERLHDPNYIFHGGKKDEGE